MHSLPTIQFFSAARLVAAPVALALMQQVHKSPLESSRNHCSDVGYRCRGTIDSTIQRLCRRGDTVRVALRPRRFAESTSLSSASAKELVESASSEIIQAKS